MIKSSVLILVLITLSACGEAPDTTPPVFDATAAAAEWNSDKTWTDEELQLLERGKRLYTGRCAGCHLRTGEGQMVVGAPALKGSAMVKGDLPPYIMLVLKGRMSMPGFARSLKDDELAAILSYERNAWGNAAGDLVLPAEVKSVRDAL